MHSNPNSTASPALHSLFLNRASSNTLTNTRSRPSRKYLQSLLDTEQITTLSPFEMQRNLQMESQAEKRFNTKWQQRDVRDGKRRKKRHDALNLRSGVLGTSAKLLSASEASETAQNVNTAENDIEDLIEEQEGLVVSSATETLIEDYAKKVQWTKQVPKEGHDEKHKAAPDSPQSPSAGLTTRTINTDPYAVHFYHSDDLDSQRIELQFWESQVNWIQEARRDKGSGLQLGDYASKKWREIGFGEFKEEVDDPLEWEHVPKARLNEWREIQRKRTVREESMLIEMQRAAEERIKELQQAGRSEEEELGEGEEHSEEDNTVRANGTTENDNTHQNGAVAGAASLAQKRSFANLPRELLQQLSAVQNVPVLGPSPRNLPTGLRVAVPDPSLDTTKGSPVARLSSLGAVRNSPMSNSGASNPASEQSVDKMLNGDDENSMDAASVQSPATSVTSSTQDASSTKRKRGRPRKVREPVGSSLVTNTRSTSAASADQFNEDDSTGPLDSIPDIKNTIIESGAFLNGILWKEPENPEEHFKNFPFTKLLIDASDRNLHLVSVSADDLKSRTAASTEVEVSENDEFMNAVKVKHTTQHKENLITRHEVQHSGPAERLDPLFYPPNMSDGDYRNYYHQELLKLPAQSQVPERLSITWKPQKVAKRKKRTQKMQERLKKKTEQRSTLSAHNHRSILIESVERFPMILNKIGMGTRIINYYPQKRFDEIKVEDCADGDLRFVENSHELPLFTELDDEHGVMSSENENFNAQIFPYKPPYTDFLLTARGRSRNKRIIKFHIRRPDAYYTQGHTQPLRIVPTIPSREVDNYKSNRVLQFIKDKMQESLAETGESIVVKREVEAVFPVQKHLIRQHLKMTESIGGNRFRLKKDALIAEKLVTPEEIACYDMTRADDVRLGDMGIDAETQKIAFGTAFDMSQNISVPDKIDQDVIRRMSHVILDASWRKTSEFHNLISASAERNFSLLEVSRASFDSEKLRRMSEECKRLAHEELDKLRHDTGVNLTDEQARRILKEQGNLPDDRIENMTRTERKEQAKRLTESEGKISESRKKMYIQILSEKKRQALRRIYAAQADKLRSGRPLYQSLENQRAVMNADDEDDDRSESSSLDEGSDDEQNAMPEEEEYMDEDTELNNQIRDMIGTNDAMDLGITEQQDQRQLDQQLLNSDGYRVVRTVYRKVVLPDHSVVQREERQIITDPDMVELYRKRDTQRKSKKNKKQIYIYTKEDKHMSDIFVTGKKEHRRLREQYKRWHKRIKNKPELVNRVSISGMEGNKKRPRAKSTRSDGGAPKQKRRRKISLKVANERLRKIIGNYTKNNKWKAFNEPVDVNLFPDYNQHIPRTITLKEVYQKAKTDTYHNIPEFEQDLQLIEDNCRRYCGEIHPEHSALIPLVEDLMDSIRTQLEKFREDVERAFHGETVEALIAKGQAPDFVKKNSNSG